MTPDIFRQSKHLFLIFPPGCGGNHFANLLCMHPVFAPRYSHDNYYENLEYQYQHYFVDEIEKSGDGCTAHFSDLENLQLECLKKVESKILNHKEPYVFCSHAIEYLINHREGNLCPYDKKIFCLFTRPTGTNKLVYDRMHNGLWYRGEQDDMFFFDTNIMSVYEKEKFAELADTDVNKIFTLDTDIFYTVKGYDYIYETIKEKLGFELPEICRKMHTQYIEYSSIIFGTVDK